ncbi:ATP synthase mitochondrial F1 complex assembly factor 2 [Paramuricea clavata]|uniref:ATP synthase mitochondrial F1 complex assembly factor 2 n=1 Tax=Paramuricea clavata TaxID=317549 RepID=A0A6S7HAF1_PARCT|nr:ATP synthase mitochondrial F1 complex assembly factor 2 [Paramuricea clavata]
MGQQSNQLSYRVLFRGFSVRFARSVSTKQVSNCCRKYLSSFRDRKRFYKKVDVIETKKGYQVTLDDKTVKTPHGRQLCVPYQPLAAALSVEWDAQEDVIKPAFMHLTALTNTVLDDPLGKTVELRIHEVLEYLLTDTVW